MISEHQHRIPWNRYKMAIGNYSGFIFTTVTGLDSVITMPAAGRPKIRVWTLVIYLFMIAAVTPRAEDVLIVNSDRSIRKYALVEEAYKRTIDHSVAAVDLGSDAINESAVNDMISQSAPDVIYCVGARAYGLLSAAKHKSPLVVTSVINWDRLPRLRRSTYGVYNETPTRTQLVIFRYFFPELRRVGVLYNKKHNTRWLKKTIDEGRDKEFEIIGYPVRRPDDIKEQLPKMLAAVDAVWFIPDPIVMDTDDAIIEIFRESDRRQKPIFAYDPIFADAGASMTISVDIPTIGRQAAELTTDIISRTSIADRFQSPIGSEIALNLKKIEAYGIKVNALAMSAVNKFID